MMKSLMEKWSANLTTFSVAFKYCARATLKTLTRTSDR